MLGEVDLDTKMMHLLIVLDYQNTCKPNGIHGERVCPIRWLLWVTQPDPHLVPFARISNKLQQCSFQIWWVCHYFFIMLTREKLAPFDGIVQCEAGLVDNPVGSI